MSRKPCQLRTTCERCYGPVTTGYDWCGKCRRIPREDQEKTIRRLADIVRNMRHGRIPENQRTNALAWVVNTLERLHE